MEQRPVAVGYSPAVEFVPRPFALRPGAPRLGTFALTALSLWWPAADAAGQTGERSLLRQLYGDLAFEVRTRGQGSLTIGVADSRTSLVLTFMATDLRRWSDSASRVLAARAPRRAEPAKWEAVVAGPGVVAGSMSLARSIAGTDTTIVLLVTDTSFHAVRTVLTAPEARALTAAMKRAANASLPTKPPPPPKATPPNPKKPPETQGWGFRDWGLVP